MDISKINTSVLRSLIKLTERRDALVTELQKVERALAAAYGGKAAPVGRPGGRRRRRKARKGTAAAAKPEAKAPAKRVAKAAAPRSRKRGALKARILSALKAAGDKGVSVKELSEKLGVKNQNIHVWFSSTGKKLPNLQKIGAGRYRLKP